MRTLRAFALTIAALTLLACETPTDPASQLLALSSNGSVLTLTNPNSWPVFYSVVDPNWLALGDRELALSAPCADPACPHVLARSSVRVPYSAIGGYHAGLASVQITQWRLSRSSSGDYRAIDVRSDEANIQP